MSTIAAQPYVGPVNVDLTNLAGSLYDLAPGEMQGLRTEKEGIASVIGELATSIPSVGAAAGIPADVYTNFVQCTDRIQEIRVALQTVGKLAEVLAESEAFYEDQRENDASIIVDAVRSMSQRKRDPSILAAFEKTVKYVGQTAEKAAKTRKKNAEARKAGSPSDPSTPA